jgi:hypothetical protein
MLRDELLRRAINERLGEDQILSYATQIAEHKRDPYSLVEEIAGSIGKH